MLFNFYLGSSMPGPNIQEEKRLQENYRLYKSADETHFWKNTGMLVGSLILGLILGAIIGDIFGNVSGYGKLPAVMAGVGGAVGVAGVGYKLLSDSRERQQVDSRSASKPLILEQSMRVRGQEHSIGNPANTPTKAKSSDIKID